MVYFWCHVFCLIYKFRRKILYFLKKKKVDPWSLKWFCKVITDISVPLESRLRFHMSVVYPVVFSLFRQ